MRKVAAFIVALVVGCASSSSNHGVRISVQEQVGSNRPDPVYGQHQFEITIHNLSADVITVRTIHVGLPSSFGGAIDDATQTIDETIGSDMEQTYGMFAYVTPNRYGARDSMSSGSIDSLEVIVECEGPNGSFMETGVYPVGHVQR